MGKDSEVRNQMSEVGALGASEMFAKINAQPPLMRAKAWATYLGKEIDWTTTFFSGEIESGERVFLAFRHEASDKMIFVRVTLTDYPWLMSTRRGELVRLRGRIEDINPLTIDLEATSLEQVAST